MYKQLKQRRAFLSKDTDPIKIKAADRLDRLNTATAAGPAIETGPFAGKGPSAGDGSGVPSSTVVGHPAEGEPLDHEKMADHHQKLADYFSKIAHPGGQTTPATVNLDDSEKNELSDDIDMK